VIKPLVGKHRDVTSDAAVLRPVLGSHTGLAFAQALLPTYSAIDAYDMTACTIDEAVRRIVAVGGSLDHIGGVDNFCWPSILFDPENNPDGKFKAAQLVRSCRALKDICLAYEIPLLSGKDSMYVDGHLSGKYGEAHKISALETLQFSTTGVIQDITKCMTLDSKAPGDLVYILGTTRNEMGGSEYYEHLDYVGLNIPKVQTDLLIPLYGLLSRAIEENLLASVHGVYRGGIGIHLAMVAMGGDLGMNIDLAKVPIDGVNRNDTVLFSESAGRFIVTVCPGNREAFEQLFQDHPCAHVGTVSDDAKLSVRGIDDCLIISRPLAQLRDAWKRPFGGLI
jgi:phosphoribosylformylglycinamidine synthase